MPLAESDIKTLRLIVKKWCDIQAEIKRAEQVSRLSVGAAINELRYAGRILVAALAQELDPDSIIYNTQEEGLNQSQSISERIVIAEQYLTNADNDISDSLIYFFQKRADDINYTYGAKAVVERNPGYEKFLQYLGESRSLIIESRRNLWKRKECYEKLKPLREKLIVNYFELQKSDVMMAIEIRKHEIKTRKFRQISIILGSILLLSLVAHFF